MNQTQMALLPFVSSINSALAILWPPLRGEKAGATNQSLAVLMALAAQLFRHARNHGGMCDEIQKALRIIEELNQIQGDAAQQRVNRKLEECIGIVGVSCCTSISAPTPKQYLPELLELEAAVLSTILALKIPWGANQNGLLHGLFSLLVPCYHVLTDQALNANKAKLVAAIEILIESRDRLRAGSAEGVTQMMQTACEAFDGQTRELEYHYGSHSIPTPIPLSCLFRWTSSFRASLFSPKGDWGTKNQALQALAAFTSRCAEAMQRDDDETASLVQDAVTELACECNTAASGSSNFLLRSIDRLRKLLGSVR